MRRVLVFVLLTGLACSPRKADKQPSVSARCQRVGDSCEFAPGKLGVCVAPESCTNSSCLLCQSQH